MPEALSTPEALSLFAADLRSMDRAALKPTPRMSLPEWADTFRRLASSSGAVGGPWRTSRFEVARGAMMAVKEPGVRTISAMVATQTMKTELLLNTVGYFSHLDPCPMLLLQPKDAAAAAFSKERLAPMIRATPALRERMGDNRARRSEDTLLFKEFPGGFLALASAGSPTNLAMRAIRVVLMDEIDKYETTKEGDPIQLAEERTATFHRNKLSIRVCSPTTEGFSRIANSYALSDQRRGFVACPHCAHEQVLDFFKHVQWQKSEEGEHFPYTAAIYCEDCGAEWSESQRLSIVTTAGAIRWRQTKPFVCCEVRQEPLKTRRWLWDEPNQVGRAVCDQCGALAVPNTHAGFQASKLLSPVTTVAELAAKWLEAKEDAETKQTFYNTQLGIPFATDALKKVDANVLTTRREVYHAEVPAGVVALTAGIDVQPSGAANMGRVEIEVVGWGIGEESWSIAHHVIAGDPAKPELWAEVDAYLQRAWVHESGHSMFIRASCVDSGGHNTQDVYNFCRSRVQRNVWAIKGASDRGSQWSPVWTIPKLELHRRTRLTGYRPQIIGVNSAKEAIRQKLLVAEPGPGYCHFPQDRPDGYFDQLTAERLEVERKGGFLSRKWVLPRGRANEALDCRVYAYAALCGLYATRKFNLAKAGAAVAALVVAVEAERGPSGPEPLQNRADPTPESDTVAAPPPPPRRLAPPPRLPRRSKWA